MIFKPARVTSGLSHFATAFLLLFLTILTLSTWSCKPKSRTEADVSSVQMNIEIENLDRALLACKSIKDVQFFLDQHSYLGALYFPNSGANSAQLAGQLFSMLQNPDFQGFKSQLDSLIGDRDALIAKPLTEAFKRIKYYYPNFKAPKVKLMVSGFTGNDLYVSDSLIIIGLDYFGGPKARFRPDVYEYQLARYQKDHIVPSVIFFMAAKYNRISTTDRTLLADMIGYGKDYEFTKQILPKTSQSLILGLSKRDLERTYNSQTDIWAFFISGKLLYEKSDLIKQKYIGERPYTTEIGNKVPGGIGRWIGWRIVSLFMTEHPEVSLPDLMQMDNAVNLLEQSGYNGQKDELE